jgi:hypothetical protein
VAEKLSNGKYNPVVWRDGFVNMVELVDNEFKLVECNTLEEAEILEEKYKEFWSK